MNNDGSINRKAFMNTQHPTQRKEVTAVDSDVPLLRSSLNRFTLSELRLFPVEADRHYARHLFALRMV
jgi:hypothetical protein